MNYAYLRVSTLVQDEHNQKLGIDEKARYLGIKIDKYITDKVSGTVKANDRNLGKLLKKLNDGDTLIVSEISRLSRKMFEIMQLMNFFLEHKVRLYTVKEGLDLGDNLQSRVLTFAFGLAGELERDMIAARTREALAYARQKGVVLGRPVGSKTQHHKLDKVKVRLIHDFDKGVTIAQLCRRYKVTRKTIKKYVEAHRNDKEVIAH